MSDEPEKPDEADPAEPRRIRVERIGRSLTPEGMAKLVDPANRIGERLRSIATPTHGSLFGMPADHLTTRFAAQGEALRILNEQMQDRQDEMIAQAEAAGERAFQAESDRIDRERKALELSAGILETQQALLARQESQAADAAHDRRLEYAVIVLAILAITVPLATTVAQTTKSWGWTVLAAAASLAACLILALLIVRGRQGKESLPAP